jgi:nicotinamidase-related amidase
MGKQALVLIDLQNDYFPGGKFTLVGTEAAADNAAKLMAAFRAEKAPVIHVRHESTEPDPSFFLPGSPGAEINAKVKNQGDEPVITKNQVNAFQQTDLKRVLDEKGITDLVIVGAMSHMCVDGVTRAAVDFGYATTVIHDACATRDAEFNGVKVPAAQVHAAFMRGLADGYCAVKSTDEFLADRKAG